MSIPEKEAPVKSGTEIKKGFYAIPGGLMLAFLTYLIVPKSDTPIVINNRSQEINHPEDGEAKQSAAAHIDSKAPAQQDSSLPQLQLIDVNSEQETPLNKPELALADQTSGNNLHDYYGLDLNLKMRPVTYTIGAPAIVRYFKLKGCRHAGIFIITKKPELYYTPDAVVYNQSCNFYRLMAVYGSGWSNEISPCPGKHFSLGKKIKVYPCDGKVRYKIGMGEVEKADDYIFPQQ